MVSAQSCLFHPCHSRNPYCSLELSMNYHFSTKHQTSLSHIPVRTMVLVGNVITVIVFTLCNIITRLLLFFGTMTLEPSVFTGLKWQ